MSTTRWRARPVQILFILALALCVGMLLGPLAAGAEAQEPTTWYVSTTGSDTQNNGKSAEAPFATISHAIAQASEGDTVDVAAGTYTEQVVINERLTLQGAGAECTTITFTTTAEGGYVVHLRNCSGVQLSGFTVKCVGHGGAGKTDGGIQLENTTHSQLVNLDVSGSTTSTSTTFLGISLNASSNNEVDAVTVEDVISNGNSLGVLLSSGSCANHLTNIAVTDLAGDYAWGIEVSGSSNTNIFEAVEIANSTATSGCGQAEGIYIREADGNRFTEVEIENVTTGLGFNISYGLDLQIADNNLFSSVTIDNVSAPITPAGISLMTGASNNVFNEVDISNITDTGMGLEGYDAGVALGVAISANGPNSASTGNEFNGVSITDVSGDLTATSNGARGVYLTQYSNENVFSDYSVSGLSGAMTIGVFISAGDGNSFSNGSVTGATRGVQVQPYATDEAEDNSVHLTSIVGNTAYGVRNTNTTAVVDATNNWWGDASGPMHAGNPDGTGDAVSDNVEYSPWLGASTEADTLPPLVALITPADDPAEPVSQAFSDEDGAPLGTVTFDNVATAGTVTFAVVDPANPEEYPEPAGFALGDPPVYFDISTTATFTGKIRVCLNYDPDSFHGVTPSLFHYEGGQWVDVTKSVDTTNHIVCGEVTSLSPFALGLENVRPTVTVAKATGQADPTNASPISFTVTFSEAVSGFSKDDVHLDTGTGTAFSAADKPAVTVEGSGRTYTVKIAGMDRDGRVAIQIWPGAAQDAAGNGNTPSAKVSITYDITAPTVTINQAQGQADPTGSSPISFTVVFSEPVSGFTSTDVTLSGTAGATTALVGGSGTTYTVAVSGMTKDGTVTASVKAGAAQDAAGNASPASTSTDNVVTYSTTRPAVTINQASGQADPTGSSPIYFTAIFSEPVTGFTSADVTLSGTAGATTATVTAVSGSGITPGTTYSVAVSGMTKDGTVIASIPAGAAQDAAGNWNVASTSTDNVVTYQTRDLWTDIKNSEWLTWYGVSAAQIAGVAQGYEDGTFRPTQPITRAQFAKMVVDGYDLPLASPATPTFSDVASANYYFSWIEGAHAAGIISGYEDYTFGPETEISREQANSILGRYLSQKELEASGHIQGARGTYASLAAWYAAEGQAVLASFADKGRLSAVHAPYTAYLIYQEVVLGTTGADGSRYLDPLAKITRAQAAVLVVRTSEMTF